MPDAALKTRPQEAKTHADSPLTGARLAEVLDIHARIVDRRVTVPVLACVRLIASGTNLRVASTDLDTLLTCTLPYSGVGFSLCVPCHLLSAAAAAFGDEVPAWFVSDRHLVLSGAAGEFTIAFLPSDEFKEIYREDPAATVTFGRNALLNAIETCRAGISTEETRYYLNGLLFKQKGSQIEVVATDGHRLHLRRVKPAVLDGDMPESIVHRRPLRCLKMLLERTSLAEIDVEIGGSKASFALGDWTLMAKCIDGTYPDYSRVIPDTFVGSMSLAADDLAASLRSINRLGGDSCTPGALEPTNGRIRYRDVHGLTFTRALDCIVKGEVPERVGFNIPYLAGILATHPAGELTIRFSDATGASPTVFAFDGDDEFLAVLMPMRVSD